MRATRQTHSEDRYLQLVRAFPLRPIRSVQAHQEAKGILRGLSGQRDIGVADYKAVLVSLIVDYERKSAQQIDVSRTSAADIVRHLLAQRSMSVNAFAKALGLSQSALSDMLNGKRDWSKSTIVRIAGYFGLQPGIFLR